MATIKLRRGTSSEWFAVNPVLADGEVGIESAPGTVPDKGKIGDGSTAWNSLPYSITSDWVSLAERGVADGVASLDGSATVPDAQIPATIARDTEVTAAIASLNGTYVALVAAPGGVDDTAVVQAAINAANAARGGIVQLAAGTYICTTLTLYGGVHLVGSGVGGDVFSNTDVLYPFRGTVLKLKNSTNADLVKTANFATLTGVASPPGADVTERFSLRHLVLDGNNGNNSSGWPLRIYGRAYRIDDVTIQNGASGGVYTEGPSGGYDMEAKWSNFDIVRCTGVSFDIQGPHDSQYVNGTVKAPGTTPSPTYGIKLSGRVGGEQFTNVHVWGGYTAAHWSIGTSVGQFLNCTSDGAGIDLLGSGNTWDGLILGTSTPGQYAVRLGDGTSLTVGQNIVRGRVTGFVASPYAAITPNTTSTGNRFHAVASMGEVRNYTAKGNVYTTTGAVIAGATTIPMSATTDLPASGSLYADDGANRANGTLAYTGKTANSLTGVTGVPAGGLDSGAAVWLPSTLFGATDFGADSFEIWDYDHTSAAGLVLRRPTPNSQSVHNAVDTFTGKSFAQEGVILAGADGAQGGTIYGGSAAPTFSATAGDFYVRTATPTTANQRLYMCTGTTNWISILPAADPLAVALGYINWNYTNATAGSGNALTSQRAEALAIWLPPGVSVSTVYLNVTTAGTSTAPTGFYVGLATLTKMVAQSNNLNASSSLTATGCKPFALNAPYVTNLTDSPAGLYYVILLQNGAFAGTNVVFQRANASTPSLAPNGPTAGNIGTGLTVPPADGAAVTVSGAAGLGFHVGVA